MRVATALALAATLGACAFTSETIDVPYQAAGPAPAAVAGAQRVAVAVSGKDGRLSDRDRISSKKNGFGMETAPILASHDVVETVRRAIESELAARGFAIGATGVPLTVEVTRFYNDFGMGVVTGDASAEVSFHLLVKGESGPPLYARQYTGRGRETGVMLFTGDNARLALVAALSDAVRQAAADRNLMSALLSAPPRGAAAGKPSS